ncbi:MULTISPECIES: hypothetical protein [Pseudoalteromonas]|uniref:DUF4234 domain-containing protein n=1 Tax=Pseudoalteromonas luteoviolacea (strain 2ta16) TaxID=1353533 RepID=V4JBU8_PSEL2|nr:MULTISPECIES: hypothetical protein [Pseudoalteromonas]ESP92607.1 hypothetical protein PL2TA16_04200 [Pseudoalteromonas luteoviolacea 2ta16]MCG7550497.1 hypothetical protein [Pseudoalteromonas sp. Of7M-16]
MSEEVLPRLNTDEPAQMQFYIVSAKKFWTLSLMTLGIYALYWFYKHWSEYKKSTGEDIWPVPRAIFSIFFTHSLFSFIEVKYEQENGEKPIRIIHYATAFVIVTIVGGMINTKSGTGQVALYIELAWYLTLVITSFCCFKAQMLVNKANNDPSGSANSSFTLINYVFIFIGVALWYLVLLGTYTLLTDQYL